jgi:F-type H+-transporting ATPase subunit alpha
VLQVRGLVRGRLLPRQQQLARGARVIEVLKQPQYQPLAVEKQVVYVYAATTGVLDDYPVEDAKRFVVGLGEFLDTRSPEILSAIRTSGDLSDDTTAALDAVIGKWRELAEAAERAGKPAEEYVKNLRAAQAAALANAIHQQVVPQMEYL